MLSFHPRSRVIVASLLALIPLLYFYPAVLGRVLLAPGDAWTQSLGLRVLIGQMLAQGELPLWNPYIFAGMPLLASIHVGALYPPSWLFVFLPPGVAMNAMVITTCHLSLIGTYLYARRIGANRTGALIAGIAFTFGGYMTAHLGHTSRTAAAAWLPWILLAIEALWQNPTWKWTILGAIFVALQLLAGEPQMTLYTVLTGGLYAGFSLLFRPTSGARVRFVLAGLALSVLGVLLSAIQLWPERELLQQGERAQITYEYFSAFSLPPRQILTLVFPYFFGGGDKAPYSIPYWGQSSIGETCIYVGLLSLFLTVIAISAKWRERIIWFWSGLALIALLLSFGSYLPFELYRIFHRLPVYNLFRVPARHGVEFTFAIAVLAGLGLTSLSELTGVVLKRVLVRSTAIITVVVVVTTLLYRFASKWLVAELPLPLNASSLTNWEVLFPLGIFALSAVSCGIYARQKSWFAGGLMVALLLMDLALFGHFFYWKSVPYRLIAQLADPPTVSFIKSREADLNAFRIYSLPLYGFDGDYWMVNMTNVSAARGLQSVNGYDALRLNRLAEVAGEMDAGGFATDTKVFAPMHRGLDILNVRYLLYEQPGNLKYSPSAPVYDGVPFNYYPFAVTLKPGEKWQTNFSPTLADELALVSTMSNALHLPDDTPMAKVTLYAQEKIAGEYEIRIGRDTAEWAIENPVTRANARHRPARIVESWQINQPTGAFAGHRYLARTSFQRAEITRIEIQSLTKEGDFSLSRATLRHQATGDAFPLPPVRLPAERWQKLARYGQVEVYENTQRLPRAWFVNSLSVKPSAEVLNAIKTGQFAEHTAFDPVRNALLEFEDFGGHTPTLPPVSNDPAQQAVVTEYRPHSIKITTKNAAAGFLVLSEIYSRDWEARIDGQKTPIYRANYLLRGLAVPAGEHQIEFYFRGPSFRNGAMYSALGTLLIALGTLCRFLLKWQRSNRAR